MVAMIDHLTLTVRDVEKSVAFYARALKALGYGVTMRFENFVGLGTKKKPVFWLKSGPTPTQPMHLAFVAPSRQAVDQFHADALAAGAQDDGPPGLRPHYHVHYYGAFVVDPDGHPVEAVCHSPPEAKSAAKAARKPAGKAKRSVKKRRGR
jgi:catechol 2,3-dioxygenase-like lactoylglutathione lyase family enzyme